MEPTQREVARSCHNCGLTGWAIPHPGVTIRLRIKAENRMRRDRNLTIWCCSDSCAWESLAIAAMGLPTHKWPVSFKDFISLNAGLLERSKVGFDRYEIGSQPVDSTEAKMDENENMALHPYPEFRNAKKGRKTLYKSNADRQRAYRARRRQTAIAEPKLPASASVDPKMTLAPVGDGV